MLSASQKKVLDFIDSITFEEKFLTSSQISHWMRIIRDLNNVKDLETGIRKKKFVLKEVPSLSNLVVEMRNANR
jgi:hypothetical protein